jgi:hypothetical protein
VPSTVEENLAKLTTLTGLSQQEWTDFMTCTPEQQEFLAKGYAKLEWVKNPDTLTEVIAVLTVLSTIAGAVTGIAGAVGGVAGAITALEAL